MKLNLVLIGVSVLLGGCGEESELEYTKRLANNGDAKAQHNLGVKYANGTGVPQDYKAAVKWYRMSAEQGDAMAQSNLGLMYANGSGVPQDYKEAVKWFRLSAEQGNAMAQSNLGVMYTNGAGVPQDYKEAYVWFSIAKANGYENLDNNLLDNISKEMTKEQITEAQSLSTEMLKRIEANIKN